MAGTSPSLVVKVGANIEALKAALALGEKEFIKVAASAEKLAKSMDGSKLEAQAKAMAVAITSMGGAATMTAAEAKKADAVFTQWFDKAAKQGKAIAPELAKIAEETKKVAKETENAEKQHQSWFKTIASGAMTGTLLAEGLMKAGSMVVDVFKDVAHWLTEIALEGSRELGIEKAFKRLTTGAGQDGLKLLHELQKATHGTVEESALMIRVNENLATGMRLTTEQYQTMAKGAFALAKATGTDVKEAMDRMSDAMITGRTRAVALITGKIDAKDAEEKFAKALGRTAEELSAEGKIEAQRQAILAAVGRTVDRLGEQTDGLGTKVKQAKVAWKDFQEELGKAVAGSPVLMSVVNNIGELLSKAFGVGKEQLVRRLGMAIDQLAISSVGLAAAIAPAIGIIGTEFNALQVIARNVMQFLDLMLLGIKQIALAGVEAVDAMTPGEQFADQQIRLRTEIAALRVEMVKRKDAMDADKQAEDEWWNLGERLKVQLEEMQQKMEGSRRTFEAHKKEVDAGSEALDTNTNKFFDSGNAADGAGKKLSALMDETKKLETAFVTLQKQGATNEQVLQAVGSSVGGLRAKFAELGRDVPADVQKLIDAVQKMAQEVTIAKAMEKQREDIRKILEESVKDAEALAAKQREAVNKGFIGNLEIAAKAQDDLTRLQAEGLEDRIKLIKEEMKQVDLGYTKGRESYKTLQQELLRLEEARYRDAIRLIEADSAKRRAALDKNKSNYQMALNDIAKLEGEAKEKALRTWLQRLEEMDRATKSGMQKVGETMSTLGQVFDNINSKFGQTIQIIGGAFEAMGDSGKAMGDRMVAGFSAAAAVVQQYAAGTAIAAAATGALSGASAGALLASFTSLGGAAVGVGAAIGAIIGLYSYLNAKQKEATQIENENRAALEKLNKEFMRTIGTTADWERLSDAIGAVWFELGKTDVVGKTYKDMLDEIAASNMSAAEKLKATQKVYESFQQRVENMLKSVTEGAKIATQELLDFMQAALKTSGELSKTAREYFMSWTRTAGEGLTSMFAGLTVGMRGAEQRILAEQLAIARRDLAELSGIERQEMEARVAWLESRLKALKEGATTVFVSTQEQAAGLAAAIAATFGNMIAQGATFREALATIQGPLDALRKQLELTGFSGGAAFENLSRMGEIASNESMGPLADGIIGIQQALQGLHNSGMLTQEMFTALTMSASDMYAAILAQGGDPTAALTMIVPTLQTMWELEQRFGYEVDDATQALIDQAVEAGLVGAAHMSAADRTAAAMDRVVVVLESMATFMGVTLPAAADVGARRISDSFGQIQPDIPEPWASWDEPPEIIVPVTFETTNEIPGTGGNYAQGGVVQVQYLASGGLPFVPKGTDTVPAMLTPGERVLTVEQNRAYEALLQEAVSMRTARVLVEPPVVFDQILDTLRQTNDQAVSAQTREVNLEPDVQLDLHPLIAIPRALTETAPERTTRMPEEPDRLERLTQNITVKLNEQVLTRAVVKRLPRELALSGL